MQILDHEIEAIAIDIDGTMASNIDVSSFGLEVLRDLSDRNIPVIILTGRGESAAVGLALETGIKAPVISYNGAIITDPLSGKRLALRTMDNAKVHEMVAFAGELELQPFVWQLSGAWTDRDGTYTEALEAINRVEIAVGPEPSQWNDVLKVIYAADAEYFDQNPIVQQRYPELERSLPNYVETSVVEFRKWQALQFVLEQLGTSPKRLVGFGDGDTDIEWLSNIGMPIAVENATTGVKAVAKHTIGHHSGDSVAKFLQSHMDS